MRGAMGIAGGCRGAMGIAGGCRGAMGIAGGLWRVKPEPFCLFLALAEAF
jgi:hypothetical protein